MGLPGSPATKASVAFGLATAAAAGLHAPAFVWAVTLAFALILGTAAVVEHIRGARLTDAALRRECCELSESIYALLQERNEDDPTLRPWWDVPGWDQKSRAEQSAAFEEHGVKSIRHGLATVDRYKRRHQDRARSLLTEAERRGLIEETEPLAAFFDHVVNPLGVEAVARQLGKVGHRT
jgi:hypothetical protein